MYLRGVVLESRYAEDLDNLRQLYPEMDQVEAHLESELSENPRLGDLSPTSDDFRVYTTGAVGQTPAFWVTYTFDVNQIFLHSIKIVR